MKSQDSSPNYPSPLNFSNSASKKSLKVLSYGKGKKRRTFSSMQIAHYDPLTKYSTSVTIQHHGDLTPGAKFCRLFLPEPLL
ncbi:MAG: hypothetical protein KDD09_17465, partial [Phaeodactylibacter sp.]|nr:hypothetical protein [Phaeodactylibacter sp.]